MNMSGKREGSMGKKPKKLVRKTRVPWEDGLGIDGSNTKGHIDRSKKENKVIPSREVDSGSDGVHARWRTKTGKTGRVNKVIPLSEDESGSDGVEARWITNTGKTGRVNMVVPSSEDDSGSDDVEARCTKEGSGILNEKGCQEECIYK